VKKIDRPAELLSRVNINIPGLPADEWGNAQNNAVKNSLIPVTIWLGFLYLVLSFSHFYSLDSLIALPMSLVHGLTALILFGMFFVLKKINLPLSWAHPFGFLLIILSLVNSLTLIILTRDISLSFNLVLILLGISIIIVDDRWFLLLIFLVSASWGISNLTLFLGFPLKSILVLFTTIGLAFVAHYDKVSSLKKLVIAEYQERFRKKQLENVIVEMRSTNDQLHLTNSALEAAANGIAITDPNGNFIWVNSAFSKLTGYSSDEIIGKKTNILKSGAQDDAFYEHLWDVITKGGIWTGTIINRRKDGSVYHEEETITPVTNKESEITHFIGIKQDISDRIKAQEALEHRNQELIQLNKAISIITSSLNLDEVEENIVETVIQILPQVSGATLQLINESGELVTRSLTKYGSEQSSKIPFRIGVGVTGIALRERRLINIGNVENDPRFLVGKFPPRYKSLVSIPIIYRGYTFGTLSIGGKTINAFSPQDERLLNLLTDYAAAAIQNSLYSENLEEIIANRTLELEAAQGKLLIQQQTELEIRLAVDVQESLLPLQMPDLPGFSIAAIALPAHSVSGDFYDFVINNNHEVSLVLADIAGKGIPAAMLTSTARSLFRISSDQNQTPAIALCEVNSRLYDDLTHAGMFITMLVAQINPLNGKIIYANAGHTEALWWHDHNQTCESIPVTGIPLGVLKEFELSEREIAIRPDDILLFYSDGITEATNPLDQLYGLKRLQTLLHKNSKSDTDALIQKIIESVDQFCKGIPHSDDITLIILKALPRRVPFVFPAVLDQLDSIASLIRQNTEMYGSVFAYQIELATSEIVTNIIEHAYAEKRGELRGEISVLNDHIEIDFFDDGISFELSSLPIIDFTQPHEGGYGLYIAKQLIEKVDYFPATPSGNHWHLEKKIYEQ
jgi:phosphoserine phosphatase RsbU/P